MIHICCWFPEEEAKPKRMKTDNGNFQIVDSTSGITDGMQTRLCPWALLTILAVCLTVSASAAQLQVLKGHVPKAAKTQQPVGSLDASARLDLALGLPLRNPDQLTNLLQTLYKPGSTNFRRYLTPEQFTAAFGPTEKDYQAVIDFAAAHGLKVTGTHSNRTLVDVNGTVADVEKALHVHLRLYQHPTEARKFFAPDAEPSVELNTPLLAISGLDNLVVPHPLLRRTTKSSTQIAHPLTGSGSSGSYMGSDFRAAYVPGVSLTGAGQWIGLFELDGYKASDITTYESEASLANATLTNVLIDGFNGSASLADGDDEVALDIDMAHSMAPAAGIIVYEGLSRLQKLKTPIRLLPPRPTSTMCSTGWLPTTRPCN